MPKDRKHSKKPAPDPLSRGHRKGRGGDRAPLVTAVIPCYNQGHFLKDSIGSILKQTFQDFEIIVVNDGSTEPKTKKILDKLNSPKTRVYHQKNKGLAGARNGGISQARGEIILTLDADDMLQPTYFEKAVRIFKKYPKVGIVYTGVEFFGPKAYLWKDSAPYKPYSLVNMLFNFCIPSCGMFRKVCWQKAGGYDPAMVPAEDRDFWLSIIKCGWQPRKVNGKLYRYRKHGRSMAWEFVNKHPASKQGDILAELLSRLIRKHSDLYIQEAFQMARRILNVIPPPPLPPTPPAPPPPPAKTLKDLVGALRAEFVFECHNRPTALSFLQKGRGGYGNLFSFDKSAGTVQTQAPAKIPNLTAKI